MGWEYILKSDTLYNIPPGCFIWWVLIMVFSVLYAYSMRFTTWYCISMHFHLYLPWEWKKQRLHANCHIVNREAYDDWFVLWDREEDTCTVQNSHGNKNMALLLPGNTVYGDSPYMYPVQYILFLTWYSHLKCYYPFVHIFVHTLDCRVLFLPAHRTIPQGSACHLCSYQLPEKWIQSVNYLYQVYHSVLS